MSHVNRLKPYLPKISYYATPFVESENEFVDMEMSGDKGTSMYKDIEISEYLSEVDCERWLQLLVKHKRIFTDVPGFTDKVRHDISLIENKSIICKPYKVPYMQ